MCWRTVRLFLKYICPLFNNLTVPEQKQCCGSGSGRIRNFKQDPHTDPKKTFWIHDTAQQMLICVQNITGTQSKHGVSFSTILFFFSCLWFASDRAAWCPRYGVPVQHLRHRLPNAHQLSPARRTPPPFRRGNNNTTRRRRSFSLRRVPLGRRLSQSPQPGAATGRVGEGAAALRWFNRRAGPGFVPGRHRLTNTEHAQFTMFTLRDAAIESHPNAGH